MRYDVKDIVRDVRVALDQNVNSTALTELGDVDTLSLDEIIQSKVADGVRLCEQEAPLWLLDGGRAFGETIGWDSGWGHGCGHIHLPDDFLRLIVFQMSDWARPVHEAISGTDPLYHRQSSRWGGLRGSPERPIVAIVEQPIGLVLEFYSCTGGEKVYVKMARYLPIPRVRGGQIEVCEKLRTAVVYYIGWLVALALQDGDSATALIGIGKKLLGAEAEQQA